MEKTISMSKEELISTNSPKSKPSKQGQYLSKEDLFIIPNVVVKPEDLGANDNINETKLLEKYLSYDDEGQTLIYKAAIQLAVIGYGNKNYGYIRSGDKDVIMLEDIFKKYKIKYNEKLNSGYNDDDLSVRRLLRLFRFQIQKFIIDNKRPSYLWLKYADKDIPEYYSFCFPGGEHLIDNYDQAMFMINTYNKLDIVLNSKFTDRLKRVFIARGIINPSITQITK